jgi:ATP-binding cassette, subfamily C, bacterial CydC
LTSELKLPLTRTSVVGFLFAALEAISAVALLATSAFLISRASQQPPILYLMVAVVGVRTFALGRASFRYFQRLALHAAVFRNLGALRPLIFEKLAALAPGGLSERGESLERFTSDVERLQDGPLRVFTPLLQAASATAAMFVIASLVLPEAGIWLLLISLLSALGAIWLSASTSKNVEAQRLDASQQLRSKIQILLSHADLISSYGWASQMRLQLAELENRLWSLDRRRVLPLSLAGGAISLGGAVAAVAAGWVALAQAGSFDPVHTAALLLLPLAAFDVYSQLQPIAGAYRGYRISKLRLQELLGREVSEELLVSEGARDLESVRSLELENLSVTRTGKRVLQNISLRFKAGELTAVTGASGCGKSTLAMVIASLISPKSGIYKINGESAQQFSLVSRRSHIVLIEQNPHLFRGTLRQNLEISGEVDEIKMLQALEKVGLLAEFENRGLLEAEISEDSTNISGGQAQRLAIARGLLAKASVLILDEPSSGLDRQNAADLFALLSRLSKAGMIVIALTHDHELARSCDQQISLDRLSQ